MYCVKYRATVYIEKFQQEKNVLRNVQDDKYCRIQQPFNFISTFFPIGTFQYIYIYIFWSVKKWYDGNGARVCLEVQVVSSTIPSGAHGSLVGNVWQVKCKEHHPMFLQRSAHWKCHPRHGRRDVHVPLWSPALHPPSHRLTKCTGYPSTSVLESYSCTA